VRNGAPGKKKKEGEGRGRVILTNEKLFSEKRRRGILDKREGFGMEKRELRGRTGGPISTWFLKKKNKEKLRQKTRRRNKDKRG